MTTFTAKTEDVERTIAAVLPHTSADEYLPVVCCVHIEISNGQFLAVATDRYTLGVSWSPLTDWDSDSEAPEDAAANIYARDLRRLFTFLKPHKRTAATWELSDGGLTVTVAGESLTVRTVDVDFVKWRAMMPKLLGKPKATIPAIAFDPVRIESFIKSAKVLGERVLHWELGGAATDAPIVRIGNHFFGVLMPVRIPDDLPALDLTAVGIEAPKAVAA